MRVGSVHPRPDSPSFGKLLGATCKEWQRDHPTLLAGGLSFFTLLSLAPLMISLLFFFGKFVDRGEVVSRFNDIFGGSVGQLIGEWTSGTRRHHGISTFSALLLIYSISRTFRHLQTSLNIIWNVPEEQWRLRRHFIQHFIFSIVMVVACWLLLLTLVLLNSGMSFVGRVIGYWLPAFVAHPGAKVSGAVVAFCLSVGVFAGINKWLPNTRIRWSDVLPGALLTAVLFAIGKGGLSLYFGGRTLKPLYGTAGSVIIVMIWVYVSAQIFFFGAVFTRLYTEWYGSHQNPTDNLPSGS